LKKPISVIIKNEIHHGRSLLKMRLKAYVIDIRHEFPFMSNMTETVMSELLRQRLVNPEELAFVKPTRTVQGK
jgi:MscS family membrane protein